MTDMNKFNKIAAEYVSILSEEYELAKRVKSRKDELQKELVSMASLDPELVGKFETKKGCFEIRSVNKLVSPDVESRVQHMGQDNFRKYAKHDASILKGYYGPDELEYKSSLSAGWFKP